MEVDEIEREAVALPAAQRGRIASSLLRSLPPNAAYDVSDLEVADRFRELDAGEVQDISLAELESSLGFGSGA